MEVLSFQQKAAKTTEEAMQKQYQFWSTQPVPRMGNIFSNIVNSLQLSFSYVNFFPLKFLYVKYSGSCGF